MKGKTMPLTDRITPLSNLLFWACTILVCVLPVVIVLHILRGWADPALLLAAYPAVPATVPVTPLQSTLVAALAVVASLPLVATFFAMRRLFGRYRQGEILSDACADDILRIGQALFAAAAMTVILPTLHILILSWGAGEGQRLLAIGLDGSTLGFLMSGGLLIVIGWIMREAARVAEDAKGFV
jgi:Protein of unknown function (DUF2975)